MNVESGANVGIGNGMGGGGTGSDSSGEKPGGAPNSGLSLPHLFVIGSRGDPGWGCRSVRGGRDGLRLDRIVRYRQKG